MAELTLASFNLHFGTGSRTRRFPRFDVVAACKVLDADVLVLQEAWVPDGGESQLDEIAAGLGMEVAADVALARATVHPHPKVTGRGGTSGFGTWNLAVLSRLPVLGARTVALPHLRTDPTDRAVHVVEVRAGTEAFTVAGTHLPHLEAGALLRRRALRDALPARGPAALAGDMNMWRWCIRWMAPSGWRGAVRGGTFPAGRPLSQIDHLVVTPDVGVVSAEVLPDLGSDHRAIRARLRF
ncbi:MAG: endonuclease/exonuclease/phosphatase family protein [Acidimicrobiia bacterium]